MGPLLNPSPRIMGLLPSRKLVAKRRVRGVGSSRASAQVTRVTLSPGLKSYASNLPSMVSPRRGAVTLPYVTCGYRTPYHARA